MRVATGRRHVSVPEKLADQRQAFATGETRAGEGKVACRFYNRAANGSSVFQSETYITQSPRSLVTHERSYAAHHFAVLRLEHHRRDQLGIG